MSGSGCSGRLERYMQVWKSKGHFSIPVHKLMYPDSVLESNHLILWNLNNSCAIKHYQQVFRNFLVVTSSAPSALAYPNRTTVSVDLMYVTLECLMSKMYRNTHCMAIQWIGAGLYTSLSIVHKDWGRSGRYQPSYTPRRQLHCNTSQCMALVHTMRLPAFGSMKCHPSILGHQRRSITLKLLHNSGFLVSSLPLSLYTVSMP